VLDLVLYNLGIYVCKKRFFGWVLKRVDSGLLLRDYMGIVEVKLKLVFGDISLVGLKNSLQTVTSLPLIGIVKVDP